MSYDPYRHPAPQNPPVGAFAYQAPNAAWSTPPPAPRRRWLPIAAAAVGLLGLAMGGLYVAYDKGLIFKDPGIAACEAFRDGGKINGAPVDTKADGKMTEEQYLKLREIFKSSRYDDIEKAGTTLMDVMWQVTQLGPNPGLEALPYVGQIMDAMTGIQGACANHGIVVTLKTRK